MEISNQRESAFEIIKNERQMIQQRYAEQANLDISSLDFQKERHSIRSFGTKLAQKINPNSLISDLYRWINAFNKQMASQRI